MTVHIESKKGEIAPRVLMPGDPNRAKYIAEKYLEDVKLVNQLRGELAFTGYYKNKKVIIKEEELNKILNSNNKE